MPKKHLIEFSLLKKEVVTFTRIGMDDGLMLKNKHISYNIKCSPIRIMNKCHLFLLLSIFLLANVLRPKKEIKEDVKYCISRKLERIKLKKNQNVKRTW